MRWWRPLVVITSVNLFFSPSQVDVLTGTVASASTRHPVHCPSGAQVLPRSLRTMPVRQEGQGQERLHDDEASVRSLRFYDSVGADFDTSSELRWSFLLEGMTEDGVEPLITTLREMGFTKAEPMTDENREGRYVLWLAEVRIHTAASFAMRAATIEDLAARKGLTLSDYAVSCE